MAFVHIQHYGVRHSFLSRLPTTVRSLRLKAYIGEKVVHLPPRYTVALLTKLCGLDRQGRGGFPFDTDSHLHYIFLTHPISTFLDGPRHQQTPDNPFRDCRGFAYFFLPRYC